MGGSRNPPPRCRLRFHNSTARRAQSISRGLGPHTVPPRCRRRRRLIGMIVTRNCPSPATFIEIYPLDVDRVWDVASFVVLVASRARFAVVVEVDEVERSAIDPRACPERRERTAPCCRGHSCCKMIVPTQGRRLKCNVTVVMPSPNSARPPSGLPMAISMTSMSVLRTSTCCRF